MKIQNKSIIIKNGEKTYEFHNLILDEYLQRFVRRQLEIDKLNLVSTNTELKYMTIKFDTPLQNIKPDSVIQNYDFDICVLLPSTKEINISDKNITVQYTFLTNGWIKDYKTGNFAGTSIFDYVGRKVTALGFNSTFVDSKDASSRFPRVPVCAVLDLSSYDIYIQKDQEFTVTRKDIVSTEAIFTPSDRKKIPFPLHLIPTPTQPVEPVDELWSDDRTGVTYSDSRAYGILEGVGFGYTPDKIDYEYSVGTINSGVPDVLAREKYTSIQLAGLTNDEGSTYKYIIFKYSVYQEKMTGTYDNPIREMKRRYNYYYLEAVPINTFGNLDVQIKYERK